MKAKLSYYVPLLWLLSIPILNVFYGILNREGPRVRSLMTVVDVHTPFISYFVIPYLIWYPFILGMFVYLFVKNRTVYYRTLFLLCTGLVACYITYYFFQTVVVRPEITNQVPLHGFVNFVYDNDRPYNCFPSIHVLSTYLILIAALRHIPMKSLMRWAIRLISWSIIVSTVFVKQHVVLDIAGAILLVEFLAFVMNLLVPISKKSAVSASA
ncbi:phosphatase PAP2 family protein [Paenibacillus ginsengarvi]|uniref:Inositol phosphorylceramide synthase n=1 Tax=Paenibacillus ginsengarvi TaxID=400777 RepID=A0A3B0CC87_9BACL|nr:phosphatase PAP2 family protein [Paenibacillus ginsengarvi]RKN83975.1 inositol phosphorylceramide synthase [Paenibacillus ginsengarvi]